MEIYQNTKDGEFLEDLYRRIDNAIVDYCHLDTFREPLDLSAASTIQYNGCLMYISQTVLKRTVNVQQNNIIDYNNNMLLDGILNKYVSMCYIYNKIPSIYGFTILMGMSSKTVYEWQQNDNPVKRKIVKYLTDLHEHGLLAKLEDSKSPVGQIAVGNVVHNWDGRKAISGNDSRMIESNVISSKYLQLADPNDEIVSNPDTIPELPSSDFQ